MYGIELVPVGSPDTVISKAGLTPPAGIGSLTNKFFACVGQAPARVQGSRLTYSSGARGSTPNVTEHVVEGLGVQFPMQLVPGGALATRHYLAMTAARYMEVLVQAYQRRSDLAVVHMLILRVIPNLEQNATEHPGTDTAAMYRAVQPYVVIPTFAGHANGAYNMNFDVFSKDITEVENY